MGIGLSSQGVSMNRLPGWDKHSYGYHGDDGRSFCSSGTGQPYGPTFTTNDIIGCGLDYVKNTCFYTKNGVDLGTAFQDVPPNLYPTVGLQTLGETVETNFGQKPFVFDIRDKLRQYRLQIKNEIANFPVKNEKFEWGQTMQKIIFDYLVHQGYSETAKCFAKERKIETTHIDWKNVENRQKIQKLVLSGKIDRALQTTDLLYPSLFDFHPQQSSNNLTNRMLHFKLKCRRFIETIAGADDSFTQSNDMQTINNTVGKKHAKKNYTNTNTAINNEITMDCENEENNVLHRNTVSRGRKLSRRRRNMRDGGLRMRYPFTIETDECQQCCFLQATKNIDYIDKDIDITDNDVISYRKNGDIPNEINTKKNGHAHEQGMENDGADDNCDCDCCATEHEFCCGGGIQGNPASLNQNGHDEIKNGNLKAPLVEADICCGEFCEECFCEQCYSDANQRFCCCYTDQTDTFIDCPEEENRYSISDTGSYTGSQSSYCSSDYSCPVDNDDDVANRNQISNQIDLNSTISRILEYGRELHLLAVDIKNNYHHISNKENNSKENKDKGKEKSKDNCKKGEEGGDESEISEESRNKAPNTGKNVGLSARIEDGGSRKESREALDRIIDRSIQDAFSLLAYPDPWNSPVKGILDPFNREPLCLRLNGAILMLNGKPTYSTLELILGQIQKCLKLMSKSNMGQCAFVVLKDFVH
ncbi:unnamed protein product [Gordionus sp. m RMFG-2023]